MSDPDEYADRPTPITDAALCISHHPNDLLGWPEGRKAEFMGEHIVPARVCRQLESELAEVMKQRDELAKSFQLVWKHLKGERIRHDYITGTKEDGDLKTLQEVCKEALAAVKGGEL